MTYKVLQLTNSLLLIYLQRGPVQRAVHTVVRERVVGAARRVGHGQVGDGHQRVRANHLHRHTAVGIRLAGGINYLQTDF